MIQIMLTLLTKTNEFVIKWTFLIQAYFMKKMRIGACFGEFIRIWKSLGYFGLVLCVDIELNKAFV